MQAFHFQTLTTVLRKCPKALQDDATTRVLEFSYFSFLYKTWYALACKYIISIYLTTK